MPLSYPVKENLSGCSLSQYLGEEAIEGVEDSVEGKSMSLGFLSLVEPEKDKHKEYVSGKGVKLDGMTRCRWENSGEGNPYGKVRRNPIAATVQETADAPKGVAEGE